MTRTPFKYMVHFKTDVFDCFNLFVYKCCLLIIIANSLDPDQAQHLNPSCLTLWWYSPNNFSKNLILKNISSRQKILKNYPVGGSMTATKDIH